MLHVGGCGGGADSSQAMVLVLAQAWKWTLTPELPALFSEQTSCIFVWFYQILILSLSFVDLKFYVF